LGVHWIPASLKAFRNLFIFLYLFFRLEKIIDTLQNMLNQ